MHSRQLRLSLALAIAALLCLAPAAMAISGSSGQGAASAAQYVAPETDQPPVEGKAPSSGELPEEDDSDKGEPDRDVVPVAGGGDSTPTAPAPLAQASVPAAGELPFTGYVAMTVLLIGAMSLLAGVWLRRRTSVA